MAEREAIPDDIRRKVLVAAMDRCCMCPEHRSVPDLHHVIPISEGGDNTEDNLIAVCGACHNEIHPIRTRYGTEKLRMYKERWVRLCTLGLPLDTRIALAFDTEKPLTPPKMPLRMPAPLRVRWTTRVNPRKPERDHEVTRTFLLALTKSVM